MSDIKHVSADLKIHVTGDFFDPDTTEENLRYAVEQCLEDSFDDVDVRVDKDINVFGKWISVKDRLPKSMINKVLVWLEHEDLRSYIGYGHYEKFHGEEMWYDLEHGERFDKRGYIVTHWMPLPEPPKEGQ